MKLFEWDLAKKEWESLFSALSFISWHLAVYGCLYSSHTISDLQNVVRSLANLALERGCSSMQHRVYQYIWVWVAWPVYTRKLVLVLRQLVHLHMVYAKCKHNLCWVWVALASKEFVLFWDKLIFSFLHLVIISWFLTWQNENKKYNIHMYI